METKEICKWLMKRAAMHYLFNKSRKIIRWVFENGTYKQITLISQNNGGFRLSQTENSFDDFVNNSGGLVIVLFTRERNEIQTEFNFEDEGKRLQEKYPEQINFGIVYIVDKDVPVFVNKFPSIIIFKEGKELSKREGNMTKKAIQLYFKEIITEYLERGDREG